MDSNRNQLFAEKFDGNLNECCFQEQQTIQVAWDGGGKTYDFRETI